MIETSHYKELVAFQDVTLIDQRNAIGLYVAVGICALYISLLIVCHQLDKREVTKLLHVVLVEEVKKITGRESLEEDWQKAGGSTVGSPNKRGQQTHTESHVFGPVEEDKGESNEENEEVNADKSNEPGLQIMTSNLALNIESPEQNANEHPAPSPKKAAP